MKTSSSSSDDWLGIHLALSSNQDVEALTGELPVLAERGINHIILEINYDFAYQSHPELRGPTPVTAEQARALSRRCRELGIRPIPQFQCLGHQSWKARTFPLLTQYPHFDETPGQYPGNEGIYCRSWCPQHPEVNPIIFALFDELLEAFEADALHVGMDEVFLIASEHCPRCAGEDPARLFAQAINDYHAYLVERRGVEMLMWGDRLLDAEATGYGKWEAAENGTAPAIHLIPKDIVQCDWHYTERESYPSIPYFLEQGFRVWPAGWKDVDAARALLDYALDYAENPHMLGYLWTTWGAVPTGELTGFPPLQLLEAI